MGYLMRSPLNAIQMSIDMLDKSNMNDNDKELLSFINQNKSMLLNIFNDIIDLGKAGENDLNLSLTSVDVEPAIMNIKEALGSVSGIQFTIEGDGKTHFVKVDSKRFHGLHGSGIHRRNASHADDEAFGEALEGDLSNSVCHAEEQRPGNLIYPHLLGHSAHLQGVFRVILVRVIDPAADVGFVAHLLHEQNAGKQHTHLDGHHQVKHHGQHKGGKVATVKSTPLSSSGTSPPGVILNSPTIAAIKITTISKLLIVCFITIATPLVNILLLKSNLSFPLIFLFQMGLTFYTFLSFLSYK